MVIGSLMVVRGSFKKEEGIVILQVFSAAAATATKSGKTGVLLVVAVEWRGVVVALKLEVVLEDEG